MRIDIIIRIVIYHTSQYVHKVIYHTRIYLYTIHVSMMIDTCMVCHNMYTYTYVYILWCTIHVSIIIHYDTLRSYSLFFSCHHTLRSYNNDKPYTYLSSIHVCIVMKDIQICMKDIQIYNDTIRRNERYTKTPYTYLSSYVTGKHLNTE